MRRALLKQAAGTGPALDRLAAMGTWFAALPLSARDVAALASSHRVIGRGLQNEATGSGDRLARDTIPEDGSRRNVTDYNTLISLVSRRRRAHKIRDVFEEMSLDGVPKNIDTYFRAMFASMQARRLGDALYYWEGLKKCGIIPDVQLYGVIISAAGRANSPQIALQLLAEMKARGLSPNKTTFLAALNALGEAGRIEPARVLHREMLASGIACDEFGYAALLNSYKHADPAPDDSAERILALMEESRAGDALEFSRKRDHGVSIVVYNAALNAMNSLGFHGLTVKLFTEMHDKEGLLPDYDSYSAVIKSYMKEAVCGYRQFSPTHPASRQGSSGAEFSDASDGDDMEAHLRDEEEEEEEGERHTAEAPKAAPQWDTPRQRQVAPEYAHLPEDIGNHLTRLKGRVDLDSWARVTELYEITVSKGMTLSPGLHYDLMRTAVLVANTGHLDALHFAQQCLDDMQHLGMFLNTQSGSVLLAACSRRELAAGLPFAHRLWDILLMAGRVPKTQATIVYMRALQERESDWVERIAQCKAVLHIDPSRLRRTIPQLPPGELHRRASRDAGRKERYQQFEKNGADRSGASQGVDKTTQT